MRGLTTKSAAELQFLLNGKDGKADRMVTVEHYMKGKVHLFYIDMSSQHQNSTITPFESLDSLVSNTELNSTFRESLHLMAELTGSLECVDLKEFNSIPFRSLAAEQTADVSDMLV